MSGNGRGKKLKTTTNAKARGDARAAPEPELEAPTMSAVVTCPCCGEVFIACAVAECDAPAARAATVALGERGDYTAVLTLCRWHAFNLDGEGARGAREFLCPACAGPLRAEEGRDGDDEPVTLYRCAQGCSAQVWEHGELVDQTRERLRFAYVEGQI